MFNKKGKCLKFSGNSLLNFLGRQGYLIEHFLESSTLGQDKISKHCDLSINQSINQLMTR